MAEEFSDISKAPASAPSPPSSSVTAEVGKFEEIGPDLFRCTLPWAFFRLYTIPVATFLVRQKDEESAAVEGKRENERETEEERQTAQEGERKRKTYWTLVDAGYDSHVEELVRAVREKIGEDGELANIAITHGHVDHIAALPSLLSLYPQCKVVMHERERRFIIDGHSFSSLSGDNWSFKLSKPFMRNSQVRVPEERVRLITEGEEIGGVLRAIETPGHTPGSMAYFHSLSLSLLVGDAFMHLKGPGRGGCPACSGPLKASTFDWKGAKESMKKIAAVQEERGGRVFPAHDSGTGMTREEIQKFLQKL